ncbi:MAG: tetratricopeptide repeat protein [Magnetococcales bacterium]|nr:tetratricopeptide repeat protein [Magnetococcales bacterium]
MEPSALIGWIAALLATGVILYNIGFRSGYRVGFHQSKPEHNPAAYYRGLGFLLADEPDRAIEELIKELRINSETVEIHLSLGNLFRDRGEVGRAIRIHQNIIARPQLEQDVQAAALFALGEDYRQGGFLDRAVETYRRVLKIDPEHRKALSGLLSLHESEGRWDRALRALVRLEKAGHPADPRRSAHLHVKIAQESQRQGDERAAEKLFEKAIRIFPGCVEAHRLLGESMLAQDRNRAAVKRFTALQKARPSHFFLLVEPLQQACERRNDAAGFEKRVVRALEAPTASAQLFVQWSAILESQSRWESAAEVLKKGLENHPKSAELAWRLTRALSQLERWEEATNAGHDCLQQLALGHHNFQCAQCGFKSHDIYWKCPQCHRWDMMEPI